MNVYSDDLKGTLVSNPKLEQVYFLEDGTHIFTAHKCEKTDKLYARLEAQIIPSGNLVVVNSVFVGIKGLEVIQTISRDEILNGNIVEEQPQEQPQEQSKKIKRK